MAYTPVVIQDFKDRFPTYAAVMTDEQIQSLLDEANGVVDDSWREQDYKPAILYYMAHSYLSERDADAGVGSSGQIASESFGPMSRSYVTNTSSNRFDQDYARTEWGRRFARLLRLNFPAVAIAG